MYYKLNLGTTIKLFLRRSFQGSLHHCEIESQFTQTLSLSKWKGRTLVRHDPIRLSLEVQMIVFTAIRVERGFAIWTAISWSHIFVDRQFSFTDPAKNCFCVPLIFTPYLCRVISCFLMTLIAGIVFVTTFELYSNYIKRWMIMLAAGIIIDHFPIYSYLTHNAFCNSFPLKWGMIYEKRNFFK